MTDENSWHAAIMAGGRDAFGCAAGRAHPSSLNIVEKETMLEQTVERLLHFVPGHI